MSGVHRHDVQRFAALVTAQLGLSFEDDRSGQLREVLLRRASALRTSPLEYLDSLEGHASRSELRLLAQNLTVNESFFFRGAQQLQVFSQRVLAPALAAGRSLRILSAGCASGEEPYSLAMLALEAAEGAAVPISIQAIDIDVGMLERAKRAVYTGWSLRETSAELRGRWFCEDGRTAVLRPAVRALVRFEEGNLARPGAPLLGEPRFDVVFCRNVLMYFDREVARAVLARFAASLTPGGYLFLGHAETLRGLSDDFELCQGEAAFYYRLRRTKISAATRAAKIEDGSVDGAQPTTETWRRDAEPTPPVTVPPPSAEPAPVVEAAPAVPPPLAAALVSLRHERYDEAWTRLQALPEWLADTPQVLLVSAVVAVHRGSLSQAESFAWTLLRNETTHAGAHYVLALCREGVGDRAASIEHARTAVRLDPGFAMPHLHLGLLARRAGELDLARLEVTRARDLLQHEQAERVGLFGGGFSRDALIGLCRAELLACGGAV